MSELTVGQLRGLPVNNNVITVPAAHTLYAPGHVLQVVSSTQSTGVNTTSSSFVTTGLSASITPLSASSKIIITAQTNCSIANGSTVGYFTIFRGTVSGTNLGTSNGMSVVYLALSNQIVSPVACSALDSPNTTTSQTYTLAFKTNGSGAAIDSQNSSALATMILMEVAS
jgi:hypothetical protein